MSHFNARKPVSYYDNFPKGLLKRELGLPSSRSTRSNINYARRHHIVLETDFPMSVSECAIPKGMGMLLADLQNEVSNQGLPISDKYGKLSRFELCRLYLPQSESKMLPVPTPMGPKMLSVPISVSSHPVEKEIVAEARAAADDAHEAAKEAAMVAAENPSDTAAQSAAIAAQQVATVAATAVGTVVALVENNSTAAAELVVSKIEKLADASTDLVNASVKEGEAHEVASSPQMSSQLEVHVKAEEATLNVVEKEVKTQEALNQLTEAVIKVEETGVSEFALQQLKKVSDNAQAKLENATEATLEEAKVEENKVKDGPVSESLQDKTKYYCTKPYDPYIADKKQRIKSCSKGGEINSVNQIVYDNLQQCVEVCHQGRRKAKSRNRSNCKDKRKYFPKTKMSCKKRRMTWNRKSKRCNIKNM